MFRPIRHPALTLTCCYCPQVLFYHPVFLVYSHRPVHDSSAVAPKLYPTQSAFHSFAGLVCVIQQLEESRLILPSRFTLFQVASAFTNAGFSLVDQSMVPFQQAYLMIVGLVFLIIAGNTGYVSSPIWTSMRCRNLLP